MQSVYSNISIKILSQKESSIDSNTLYDIEIATPYNKWFLAKKYQQFEQLNENLQQFYHSLPEFPENSIFDMVISHFTKEKMGMKQKLQEYLQVLVVRKDVIASDFMVEFLQMNRNSPQLISASPVLKGQFSIDPNKDSGFKGIRDFYYDPQHNTFLVLTADMNALSRMNSFLINSKLPWQDDNLPTLLQVGSVQCWKLLNDNSSYHFKKLWTKIYPTQAIVIEYSKSKQRLYVGLDDGRIDELKVSPSDGYRKIQGVKSLQIHDQRVTGLYLDSLAGVMYSISQDGLLTSVQMQNCYKIMSIPHDIPLSCIIADQTNKRIFIGGDEGMIYLYNIQTKGFPRLVISIMTPEEGLIKSLSLDLVRNYLFSTGFENGLIAIFDLDKPGRQKYAKQIAMLQGKKNPRRIIWDPARMQVMVGMQDGTICFWDSLSGQPVYQFHAHTDQLSKMYYDPNKRLLITASKGQQIKFWQIPKFWRDIKTVQMQQDKIQQRRKVDNALKIKQKVRKTAQDSDQDDLLLWYLASDTESQSSDDLF